MKKHKCPYCHRKQEEAQICRYCFGDMNEVDNNLFLKRQLRLALNIDDINEIKKISEQIIQIDKSNELGNYAYAYAMLNHNDDYFKDFIKVENINFEIANHMINHVGRIPATYVNLYISRLPKDKQALLNNTGIKTQIPSDLLIDIQFRKKEVKNDYLKSSLTYLGIGLFLYLLLYFLGVRNLNPDIRYSGAVLYAVIPSTFEGVGITKLIFKKRNKIFTILFSIIVLFIISYLVLLPESRNILEHLRRVILAPVDIIDYYMTRLAQ